MNDHDISSSTHQIPILTASLTLGDEREALKQVFLEPKKDGQLEIQMSNEKKNL